MKKPPHDNSSIYIGIVLVCIAGVMLFIAMAAILESDALVHNQAASGWYVSFLKDIGLGNFVTQTSP